MLNRAHPSVGIEINQDGVANRLIAQVIDATNCG